MSIQEKEIETKIIKFTWEDNGREVGRASIVLVKNDLHDEPYALLEDVFVDESQRGQGVGTKLVQACIDKAKEIGCYKLIATSRYSRDKVHELYQRIGFEDHGKEFRMDF